MSDERTGRELTPQDGRDGSIAPRPDETSVERFDAGEPTHRVGLTEERAAKIVSQSGNARNIAFLAVLVVALFIPIYWFYDQGFPLVPSSSRLAQEKDAQQVVSIARGYELFIANCARCHGDNGQGGIGPPLNDQAKLYNAVTAQGLPGTGHLNPNYIRTVLTVGGRYVCGDANSVMPVWSQDNGGPLNYVQIDDLIAWITASKDVTFTAEPPASPGESAAAGAGTITVHGWRDPNYKPAANAPSVPACWRNPSGQIGGAAPSPSGSAPPASVSNPGTAQSPRVIKVDETASLTITDDKGSQLGAVPVKAGEVVEFQVTNTAGFDHDFYVGTADDLKAGATANLKGIPAFSSGTKSFTYTVPSSGQLQFACTIPGHYQTMHGDLQIIP
jgi:mono/diheme cytochrome c family protein/uncharacterized cupredoxin-like copper-binding protein